MRILSIDSSLGSELVIADAAAPACGQSLTVSVLACASEADSRRHAESLGLMLAQALQACGEDSLLDLVVAATGPAPFTGLRAGLVTARTVGRARGIQVLGVPSLDAVARRALDDIEAADGPQAAQAAVVTVATDARRHEVYTATYRAKGSDDVERLTDIEVVPPAALAERMERTHTTHLAGSGVQLYPEIAGSLPVVAPVSGDATVQIRVALARQAAGEELPTEPLYLRHADVQMPTRTKRHQ